MAMKVLYASNPLERIFILIAALVLFGFQGTYSQRSNEKKEFYWAQLFADGVMHRSDSLIYYLRDKPKYEYDYAFLGSAIDKLGSIDKKYSAYMQAYIDYFISEDGKISGYKLTDYNIDRIRPGLNMLELYKRTGNEKYRIAIKTLVSQMKEHPRTHSNGYWHKKAYPWQMWLDGLYMASPFLVTYANLFNQPEWFDEAAFQLEEVYKHTRDSKTGLVYHAWDESRQQRWCNPETGQSRHFWSRGTGWYMMALVDVLGVLPSDHSKRNQLIGILNDLSLSLLKVRDIKTGLWYQVMDQGNRDGNYLEASGSAMIIYAFARGAKAGYLPHKYLKLAGESFEGLIKNLTETGDDGFPVLKNTCGACGLGGEPYREGDYNYYISEKKVDNDQKGVAPVILAAIELKK
ncbi:MAG TPA: glycosyl hydrolase family 88 [Bacteroidales bacterium]|nr:glycosyl hydrolase family 88 [Bacteroidales bacterium]